MDQGGKTRFVILTSLRSGSHALADCLRQHPDVLMLGELNHTGETPEWCYDRLNNLVRRRTWEDTTKRVFRNPEQAIGFILHTHQYKTQGQYPDLWPWLWENPDVRVIRLVRQDVIAQYISLKRAQITQQWMVEEGEKPQDVKFHLVPAQFRLWRERQLYRHNDIEKQLDGREHLLRLTYEDLLARKGWNQRAMRRVYKFLGVKEITVEPRIVKQRTTCVEECVDNPDTLRAMILATAGGNPKMGSDS